MTWLSLVSLDQTTVCVFVIILALSFLWIYVNMVRGKAVQPNFNILYQTSQSHQVGNKKAQKNKGKSKLMSNPGSENKNVAATEDPATPQHKEILTSRVKKEVCSKQQVAKQQMNTKKQTTKRKAQNLPKESNKDDGRLDGKEVEVQGEWQMQLSRPQLRALRQKQQKAKDEGGQSAVDGGDKGKNMMLCHSTNKRSLGKEEETKNKPSSQNFPSDDSKKATVVCPEAPVVSDTCLVRDEDLGVTNNEDDYLGPRQDSCVFPPPVDTTGKDVEIALREADTCLVRDEDLGVTNNEDDYLGPRQDSCVFPPPVDTTGKDVEIALREAAVCGAFGSDDGRCATDDGKCATDDLKCATDDLKCATDDLKCATDDGKCATDDGKCASYSEATKPRIPKKATARIKTRLDDEGSNSSNNSSCSSSSNSRSSSSVREEPRAASMECDSQEEEDWVVI